MVIFIILFLDVARFFSGVCLCKYVEGTLKTNENWAFLARFCFLSEEGQFEYVIDYNENQGDLNLLLYYDTEDQWPAVYKSNKTCAEREAVLNAQQNQIVNLTARVPGAREFAGCQFRPLVVPTLAAPLYTIKIPTPKIRPNTSRGKIKITMSPTTTKITTTMPESPTTEITTTETHLITTTKDLPFTVSLKDNAADFSTLTSPLNTETTGTTENSLFTTKYSEALRSETTLATLLEDVSTTREKPVATNYRKAPIKKRSVPMKPPSLPPIRRGRDINCHNARRFRSSRERWWFIAVSDCNGTKGIDITYQLLMTNGPPGDYWHEHFSADEFYILPILMAFSIAYSFLMLGITVCSLELKQRQLLHTTYKIFVVSCVFQLFGILFISIVYLKMAVSGRETPKLKRIGNMFIGASETLFLLTLLLLAKGFTITRGRLPIKGSVKLTVFMCLYVMTYITIFVYESLVFDPGEVLYLYESPAGFALIILRLCAWFMFIYSTVFTLKKYPEKSNFYYPFNLFGTIWFVAGPAFVISANTYIDKWVRESIVWAVLLFIAFGGHLMFLILTMPSVANKNFPYHVRTTQIGIMEVNGNAGNSTIEQFGHHAYEPTFGIKEQTVIIPLTRRTEEIFEAMCNQKRFERPPISELQDDLPENPVNNSDAVMENVFSWSMAKNIPALDFAGFDKARNKRDSIGSASSKLTDASYQNGVVTRRPSLTNRLTADNQHAAANYDDFVNHVPMELFTVSKMVDPPSTNGVLRNDTFRKRSQ